MCSLVGLSAHRHVRRGYVGACARDVRAIRRRAVLAFGLIAAVLGGAPPAWPQAPTPEQRSDAGTERFWPRPAPTDARLDRRIEHRIGTLRLFVPLRYLPPGFWWNPPPEPRGDLLLYLSFPGAHLPDSEQTLRCLEEQPRCTALVRVLVREVGSPAASTWERTAPYLQRSRAGDVLGLEFYERPGARQRGDTPRVEFGTLMAPGAFVSGSCAHFRPSKADWDTSDLLAPGGVCQAHFDVAPGVGASLLFGVENLPRLDGMRTSVSDLLQRMKPGGSRDGTG